MRFSVVGLFALAAAVRAASITDYPDCALTCLTTADLDGCTLDDQACLCKSQNFITSSTTCIRSSCSAEDDAKAAEISNELCAAAGVTVTFTTTAAGATATASVSPTAAAATTTTANTTKASASSASVSSSIASVSSAITSAAASVSSAASSAAATTSTQNAAAPTNAAGTGAMVLGLVAAAALAL